MNIIFSDFEFQETQSKRVWKEANMHLWERWRSTSFMTQRGIRLTTCGCAAAAAACTRTAVCHIRACDKTSNELSVDCDRNGASPADQLPSSLLLTQQDIKRRPGARWSHRARDTAARYWNAVWTSEWRRFDRVCWHLKRKRAFDLRADSRTQSLRANIFTSTADLHSHRALRDAEVEWHLGVLSSEAFVWRIWPSDTFDDGISRSFLQSSVVLPDMYSLPS